MWSSLILKQRIAGKLIALLVIKSNSSFPCSGDRPRAVCGAYILYGAHIVGRVRTVHPHRQHAGGAIHSTNSSLSLPVVSYCARTVWRVHSTIHTSSGVDNTLPVIL